MMLGAYCFLNESLVESRSGAARSRQNLSNRAIQTSQVVMNITFLVLWISLNEVYCCFRICRIVRYVIESTIGENLKSYRKKLIVEG